MNLGDFCKRFYLVIVWGTEKLTTHAVFAFINCWNYISLESHPLSLTSNLFDIHLIYASQMVNRFESYLIDMS